MVPKRRPALSSRAVWWLRLGDRAGQLLLIAVMLVLGVAGFVLAGR